MTPSELEEIEKRAEKATPGPWVVDEYLEGNEYVRARNDVAANAEGTNAYFIAAARTDVPALCKALREAWARKEELKQAGAFARAEKHTMQMSLGGSMMSIKRLEAERDALRAQLEVSQAKVDRLVSRGIQDLRHENEELKAEVELLKITVELRERECYRLHDEIDTLKTYERFVMEQGYFEEFNIWEPQE